MKNLCSLVLLLLKYWREDIRGSAPSANIGGRVSLSHRDQRRLNERLCSVLTYATQDKWFNIHP